MGSWKMVVAHAVTASVLGLLIGTGPTGAQTKPCLEDLKKFCPDASPGTPAAVKCLKDHQGELSPDCKARFDKGRARMQERGPKTRDACKADVDKLCKGIEHGQGRMMACLKEHEAELSPSCKAAYEQKVARQKTKAGKGGGKTDGGTTTN